MSRRKHKPQKAPDAAIADHAGDNIVAMPAGNRARIGISSLELDEQFEVDTDPYNRTGSHFVAALRRKED